MVVLSTVAFCAYMYSFIQQPQIYKFSKISMLIVESIDSNAFENRSDRIIVVANHGEKVVVEQNEDMGPFLSICFRVPWFAEQRKLTAARQDSR